MDRLPFRRLHCRLRVFLLFLLFLLQNQDVRILPNHFLLWLHGRLQLGPRHALRDGERNIPKDKYVEICHNVILQLLVHLFLSDRLSRDKHLCEENLCNRKDRLMISNQYFTECSKLVSVPTLQYRWRPIVLRANKPNTSPKFQLVPDSVNILF